MKLGVLLCCSRGAEDSFLNATNPLFMEGVCIDKLEGCSTVQWIFGWSQGAGADTDRNMALVSGLWAESDVRLRLVFRKLYVCKGDCVDSDARFVRVHV